MDRERTDLALACLKGAETGAMAFPEVAKG